MCHFCNRYGDAVEEGCGPKVDTLLERYLLNRKINRFHSPIVRQLPPDVMSTIFEFCLPYLTIHHHFRYTEEDLSIPLSLGAICSYWRDIAWSTPSLWSSFVVCDPLASKHIIGIAQEWLARSGQLPLSIHIHSHHRYEIFLSLVDIINQYSTRWSDLDLWIPDYYYPHFNPAHSPILKSIRLSSFNNAEMTNLNFQLTCPRLERASLSSFPMDGTNIQWDNLTHLTLNSISFIDAFLILRKTPRLVFCKVSGSCSLGRTSLRSIGAPVLTSLRSLQLLVASSNFNEDFLNNLIAPDLEELSLPDSYNLSMEAITSFVRRSACSLHSFSIVFSMFPPFFEGFMGLLQSMPSLNTLSLISITTTRYSVIISQAEDYNPRNILQLVAKVVSSQSTSLQQGFLPNLKILEYSGHMHLRPENYDDLYSLIPADNAVDGPFHLLKLDITGITQDRIPKSMISYLSNLVERGITVNVMSNSEDILQSSIDYFRCRKDLLCQDWTDSIDSSLFS